MKAYLAVSAALVICLTACPEDKPNSVVVDPTPTASPVEIQVPLHAVVPSPTPTASVVPPAASK